MSTDKTLNRFHKIVPTVCFCGYSGSGKTTLANRFIAFLIERGYRPGYLKHAGHPHSFDCPGKDTARATDTGSSLSAVYSDVRFAVYGAHEFNPFSLLSAKPFDVLVMEGFKRGAPSACNVRVSHPQKGRPPEANSFACTVYRTSPVPSSKNPPEFHTDQSAEINRFLLNAMTEKATRAVPLNAAILIGGASTRMGKDKYSISYSGLPEYERLYRLLTAHPSIRNTCFFGQKEQAKECPLLKEHLIADQFLHYGPYGGILTALRHFRESAVLVVGCDYPGLTLDTVERLVAARDPLKNAVFFLRANGKIESTCGIYEPVMRYHLHRFIAENGSVSHRDVARLPLGFINAASFERTELYNANNPEDARVFLNQ